MVPSVKSTTTAASAVVKPAAEADGGGLFFTIRATTACRIPYSECVIANGSPAYEPIALRKLKRKPPANGGYGNGVQNHPFVLLRARTSSRSNYQIGVHELSFKGVR